MERCRELCSHITRASGLVLALMCELKDKQELSLDKG